MKKIGILIVIIVLTRCSFTTFQSPKTVNYGESIWGIGAAGGYLTSESEFHVEGNLYSRFGIAHNFNLGIKAYTLGIAVDVKYQFLQNPYASIDIGVSYVPRTDVGFMSSDHRDWFTLYPMIIIGGKNSYLAFKYIYVRERYFSGEEVYRSHTYNIPGVVIGRPIGSKFRLVPELNIYGYFSTREEEPAGIIIIGGLALQLGI